MPEVLDMARLTSKGQITIPASVRGQMGINEGDKILFVLEPDGRITLYGSNMQLLRSAQHAFSGAAAEAGLETIDDVVDLIHDLRD